MDYVVGLIFDNQDDCLFLEKLKPKWQAGKLNGIGGKIEANERPIDAMLREYQEEVVNPTGIEINLEILNGSEEVWDLFLEWDYGQGKVYFFRAYTTMCLYLNFENKENDVGEVFKVRNIGKTYDSFINNLNWIVPCAMFSKPNEIITVKEINNE